MPFPVLFGVNIDPTWHDPLLPTRLSQHAEQLGFDLITVQDHPYQPAFFDTWTLITHLAAQTSTVSFVPTVANLPLRPPAMLAKAAASLDILSSGRIQLGLGAGGFWEAIVAMGGPRRTPKEAVDALSEAIDVIRAMWSTERSVRYTGEHYQLQGVHPGPAPTDQPGIWLGAYGPRMLKLLGEKADGWMPSHAYLPADQLPAALARIRTAAEAAGRSPDDLRLIYNIGGNIGGIIGSDSATPFRGSVSQWTDQLVRLTADVGMNGYVFWPERDHDAQAEIFAQEVMPRVRNEVA